MMQAGRLAVFLLLGCLASLQGARANDNDYRLCMNNSICRDRYLQSASSGREILLSGTRFVRDTKGLANKMSLLAGSQDATLSPGDRMRLYELILLKTVFDEDRCPPNSYWRWSEETNQGECRCQIDRDCRVITTAVCHDTTHAAVFILGIILALLIVVDIFVRIIVDRYTK